MYSSSVTRSPVRGCSRSNGSVSAPVNTQRQPVPLDQFDYRIVEDCRQAAGSSDCGISLLANLAAHLAHDVDAERPVGIFDYPQHEQFASHMGMRAAVVQLIKTPTNAEARR